MMHHERSTVTGNLGTLNWVSCCAVLRCAVLCRAVLR